MSWFHFGNRVLAVAIHLYQRINEALRYGLGEAIVMLELSGYGVELM